MNTPDQRPRVRIRARGSGQEWLFGPEQTVVLARDPSADVPLRHGKVTRAPHAELRYTPDGWVLRDLSGRPGGIVVNGTRLTAVPVTGLIVARVGDSQDGEELEMNPVGVAQQSVIDSPTALVGAWPQPRRIETAPQTRLAGQPATGGAAPPWRLRLSLDGGSSRVFEHAWGTEITVGRDASCDLVSSADCVSRRHATVSAAPGGWVLTDLSTGGTWQDGKRLAAPTLVTSDSEFRLGDPDVGPALRMLVAAPEHVVRRQRLKSRSGKVALVALIAAVSAAAAAVTVLLTRGSSSPANGPLSGSALRQAIATTARLYQVGSTGRDVGWGSGTVISSDGLILTNAHVADPRAAGLATQYGQSFLTEPAPAYLRVDLPPANGTGPVQARFRARPVVVDGYLDLAVVKIYANADGSPLTQQPHLPFRPIGDSRTLNTGDPITVIGFPQISDSPHAATVTEGIATAFSQDPVLKSDRAWIETSARVAHGNSGGSALDSHGKLVGVPTESFSGQGTDTTFRLRAIQWAKPLIARAESGTGAKYSTPYITYPAHASAVVNGWGPSTSGLCDVTNGQDGTAPSGTTSAAVAFTITGLPARAGYFIDVVDVGNPAAGDDQSFSGVSHGTSPQCADVAVALHDSTYQVTLSFDPPGTGAAHTSITVG